MRKRTQLLAPLHVFSIQAKAHKYKLLDISTARLIYKNEEMAQMAKWRLEQWLTS